MLTLTTVRGAGVDAKNFRSMSSIWRRWRIQRKSWPEADETFYLDLFQLSSDALFTNNRGIGTIVNDD
jgi:hypothetical protein